MKRQPIKPKKKECISCGRMEYIFSNGMCKLCARSDYNPLKRTPLKRVFKPKKDKELVDGFFYFHIARCTHSEESGVAIPEPTKANICHIFDKARHKSLASNTSNVVYLTIQEHAHFDNLLYTHNFKRLEEDFKNSWPIVCQRIRDLLPLCQEETKLKINLIQYLDAKRN